MPARIAVRFRDGFNDARARYVEKKIGDYLSLKARVGRIDVYTIDAKLGDAELEKAAGELFADPVAQEWALDGFGGAYDFAVEVGFLPGVKDNVGDTSLKALEELLGRKIDGKVYTSTQYLLSGVGQEGAERIASELLANSMIQHWKVFGKSEAAALPLPKVSLKTGANAKEISLELDDAGLVKLSKDRSLALGLEDMKTIKMHYEHQSVSIARKAAGLPRWPTDVELEVIAQTQSEHCKHRIFNARVEYTEGGKTETVDSLFKTYIKASAELIEKNKDWIVSMFWDNAGVAKLNDEWNYAVKCETHNSPSALDPYGGSITGIVGVYRDPMGTGLGSKIVAGAYGFCTASPFYNGALRPAMPPRRLLDGIVEGVKDGGNKSGIPTAFGTVFFDDCWLGKPLVYVSAVGIMPNRVAGRPSHEKHIDAGDRIVMVGGRVGKDGIHGVTESSLEGGAWITAGHVQIGDPFTQKKVQDFILEARDDGLYNAITDLGGGGLSSAVGESARMSNGCTMALDKVPLKYEGLEPWQVLISESQERMALAVPERHMARMRELAEKHDVEMSDIGVFDGKGHFTATHNGKIVALLDMEFLHSGFPRLELEAEWAPEPEAEPAARDEPHGKLIHEMLARENIASKEWIQRQYDHEVQGTSALKPFLGASNDGPGDAAVIRPLLGRKEGIAIAAGFNAKYGKIDAYDMAALSLDEAIRRVIAVGASLGQIALNDNFCWPNSLPGAVDAKHKLAQLVRANRALYDYTTHFGTPCISGKDSMFVDGNLKDGEGNVHKVSGLPALMFTAFAKVEDAEKCVSMDFKAAGDVLYLVGETNNELGASEYYESRGHVGRNVPHLDKGRAKANYESVEKAIAAGLVRSCHGCYRGGLGVALALCAIAGGVGAEVDLAKLPGGAKSHEQKLYSESGGRFLVTTAPADAPKFERMVPQAARIGLVGGKKLAVQDGHEKIIDEPVSALKTSWQKTFRGFW